MKDQVKEIFEKIRCYDRTFPKEELRILLNNREGTVPCLLDAIRLPEILERYYSEELYFLPAYAI